LGRCGRLGLAKLGKEDRDRLLSLPFKLIPNRHRLGLIDDRMRERLLDARREFAADLPTGLRDAVEFFNTARYNAASTIMDNILFGKVAYGQAMAVDRVGGLIREVVDDLRLRSTVIEVGLDFTVGIGGSRLSHAQRQKVAIARCLLKRPDLLIVNQAIAALDSNAQVAVLDKVLTHRKGKGVIWVLHRANMADRFDHVMVLRNGRVVEQDGFAALDRDGSTLRALLAAD
jgi:ABC-type multidrug transport system fused ATPase/permease subunit